MNLLKKSNIGKYIMYDKLITEITVELSNSDNKLGVNSLNEDFILGYYYQKNDFYSKPNKEMKNINNEEED